VTYWDSGVTPRAAGGAESVQLPAAGVLEQQLLAGWLLEAVSLPAGFVTCAPEGWEKVRVRRWAKRRLKEKSGRRVRVHIWRALRLPVARKVAEGTRLL
jgi:hypothetical protein